jgi:hypothetical protein
MCTYELFVGRNDLLSDNLTMMEVAMIAADECPPDEGKVLFDREDLASDVELILKGDARSPEALAQLFTRFRQAIEGGLEGINQTRKALATSVELIYLHSGAHVAALKLYRLSVEGQLRMEDEPVKLIGGAIERSTAGTGKGRAREEARKKARSRNSH